MEKSLFLALVSLCFATPANAAIFEFANRTVVSEDSSLVISDANINRLQTFDNSSISIMTAGVVDEIQAANLSMIDLSDSGSVDSVRMFGDSVFSMNGGQAGGIELVNNATASLSGGNVARVRLRQSSMLNVYGTGFLWTLPNNGTSWTLSGSWSDGSPFSFLVQDAGESDIEDPIFDGGSPPSWLAPESVSFFLNPPMPSRGIVLNVIPIPAGLWLFFSALLSLIATFRYRKHSF